LEQKADREKAIPAILTILAVLAIREGLVL
jgi:hypothetical protein